MCVLVYLYLNIFLKIFFCNNENLYKECYRPQYDQSRFSVVLASLPQRWVVTVMGMLGVSIALTMRGCLSIAMTQMVVPVEVDTKIFRQGVCPAPAVQTSAAADNTTGFAAEDYSNRFQWDEETQGMVMSAFYYGYVVTHVPGGFLAQRFGGKFCVAYALMSTSTLTLLTPTVARTGSAQLMVLRFVEGLGEVRLFARALGFIETYPYYGI